MADILAKIASELYEGEDEEVAELVQKALDKGMAHVDSLLAGRRHLSSEQRADRLGLLVWEEIPVYWAMDFGNPDTQRQGQQNRQSCHPVQDPRNPAKTF